jgi:hypothetical protein
MKTITKLSGILLAAAICVAWPSMAQTSPPPAAPPSTSPSTNAPAKPAPTRYTGVVASVDSANMVVTLKPRRGTTTETKVKVTHDTKIKKDGQPAQLSDLAEGLRISGSGKKGDDGVWTASTLNISTAPRPASPKPASGGTTPAPQ